MQASCLCGALTAEIADRGEPTTILCHCRDCQRRSGSPFGVMAYYPDDALAITGDAREFTRSADSGKRFTTGFCPTCGSTLYARGERLPGVTGIAVGTLADPAFPVPHRSVYEQSRHDWIALPAGMARHPRGRDS